MNSLSLRRKKQTSLDILQHEYLYWSNEWLCRRVNPLRAFSVQHDFKSGVLFAALIELVGGVKLYGVENNPINNSQKDENINICLEFLAQRGLRPENVSDTQGVLDGDISVTLSVIYHISKLDPYSKLKPFKSNKGSKVSRQHSDSTGYVPSYNPRNIPYYNDVNKSATIGPCMAKSLPVLSRSIDSINMSESFRRSTEGLSPTKVARPTSFDLSPSTPVIMEHEQGDRADINDDGIIEIGQRKLRENEKHRTSQSTQSLRRNDSNRSSNRPVKVDRRPLSPGIQVISPPDREIFDHLTPADQSNCFVRVESADCLSNTDNNSSRCNSMCDQNVSMNSLQWDNSGVPPNKISNGYHGNNTNNNNSLPGGYHSNNISTNSIPNNNHHNNNRHHSLSNLSNSVTSIDSKNRGYKNQTEIQLLNQIKWLKRELEHSRSTEEAAKEQLNADQHMLAAFQHSIDKLTMRLDEETKLKEQKEEEIKRLKALSASDVLPPSTLHPPHPYAHGGSRDLSDFSDIENENGPGVFDRTKKKRRSWRGSLSRAFSRKKKGWEDEWGSDNDHVTSPAPIRDFLSPDDLRGVTSPLSRTTIDTPISKGSCKSCCENESLITDLRKEITKLKETSNVPPADSLVNYIFGEDDKAAVLYRVAVSIHCHNTQYSIGSVGVSQTTSWNDIDNLILSCLAKHLQVVDPGKQLGLRASSVRDYQFEKVVRVPGCAQFPESDVRALRGSIAINLRTGCSCDSIAYDSLLPLSFLRIAQSALKMEHVISLVGARHSGKTYAAELIGKNLLEELDVGRSGIISHNVIVYEADELSCDDTFERFTKRLCSATQPVVAIINNYSLTPVTMETIKTLRDSSGYKYSFIILVSEESAKHTVRNIRVVRCSVQCEPFAGILDRHFSRLLSVQPIEKRSRLKHIFNWLVSVWRHINDLLKQHVDGQCLLGPLHFFSCPPDVDKAEEWFLALWNMTLIPYVIDTVKQGLHEYGRKHTCWADPVEFVKGSYPWSTSPEYCNLLQGIHSSELNFDSYRSGPFIGGNSVLSNDQIEELVKCVKEHLNRANATICSSPPPSITPNSTPCHSSRDVSRNVSRDDLTRYPEDIPPPPLPDPLPPPRTYSQSESAQNNRMNRNHDNRFQARAANTPSSRPPVVTPNGLLSRNSHTRQSLPAKMLRKPDLKDMYYNNRERPSEINNLK